MTQPDSRATDLVAERLGVDGLRAAYSLIRLVEPDVDLRAWLGFARRLTRAGAVGSGIMAVRYAGRSFPCGLFCYRRDRDLRHGVVLTAEYLVALDLLNVGAIRATLLRELAVVARGLGCEAVRLAMPPAPLAVLLRDEPGKPSLAAARGVTIEFAG